MKINRVFFSLYFLIACTAISPEYLFLREELAAELLEQDQLLLDRLDPGDDLARIHLQN